jgi:hypothetical protein
MGLELKLTTYLGSALKTESTFFFLKKFIPSPFRDQSKNQFHEKLIGSTENRFRAYKMLIKYKSAYN